MKTKTLEFLAGVYAGFLSMFAGLHVASFIKVESHLAHTWIGLAVGVIFVVINIMIQLQLSKRA